MNSQAKQQLERTPFFTQIIRPIGLLLAFLALVVVILGVCYYGFMEYTGALDVQRLELEVARAEAQAALTQAAAERARAEGEATLRAAEGDAIRAPALAAARAVDRMSGVLAFWGVLTPGGLMLAMALAVVAGGFVGAGLAVAVTRTQEKRI